LTRLTKVLLGVCALAALLFVLYPLPFSQKLFAVGYGLDPQRPSHTYFLGGAQLPLEARKVGMFGGFAIAYLALLITGRARCAGFPPLRVAVVLGCFIAVMGLDGLNATLFDLALPHAYAPDLRLRLATGLLTGIAMAGLLLPALNGTLWRDIDLTPSLGNIRDVGAVLLVCASFYLLVDSRLGFLYYAVGVLGAAGLLLELTMINMIFALVLMRRVGSATTIRDVLPPAACGLVIAVCELAVMSVVRYVLIGDLTSLM
jgi:hypothetical protein